MSVRPKGLPGGADCCSPWQKIMERLREIETGLTERVKKVKVNGQTIYPVNDGEIVLPDYPESTGTVNAVKVDDVTYDPDEDGVVELPDYPPDVSADVDALEIEVGSLDSRLESVEDDVGTIGFAVVGLGDRLTTAEGDIDSLEGRMDTAEGDIDSLEGRMDTAEGDIDLVEQDITVLSGEIVKKPTMFTGTADPDEETVGHVGDFYLNTVDDKLWKCLTASPGAYEWTEVGGGGSGGAGGYEVWAYATASGIGRYETFTKVSDGTQLVGDYFIGYLETLTEDQIANIRVRGPNSGVINSDGIVSKNQTKNYTITQRVYYNEGNGYTGYCYWGLRVAVITAPWSAGMGLSVTLNTFKSYISPEYATTIGSSGQTKTAGTIVYLDDKYRNVTDILVTSELYQMWKDGKVSFSTGTYGGVGVKFEETVTLTEFASVRALCNGYSDGHDIMVRLDHGNSARNQRKFYPLEPVGGGSTPTLTLTGTKTNVTAGITGIPARMNEVIENDEVIGWGDRPNNPSLQILRGELSDGNKIIDEIVIESMPVVVNGETVTLYNGVDFVIRGWMREGNTNYMYGSCFIFKNDKVSVKPTSIGGTIQYSYTLTTFTLS